MARKPRMEVAPGVYHVYARGNDRRRIFLDDEDRRRYLALLAAVTSHRRWLTMAYCLMDNHVHLLIETLEPNLGRGMHRLQGGFAQWFNKRHGTTGHVFERRYGGKPVRRDEQLFATAAYIARNPVSAGLCARPELWPWGSHAAMAGASELPQWLAADRLLSYYGSYFGGDRVEGYLRLVKESAAGAPAYEGPGQ